jgi:two-component system sensor histidine kinase KdpD
MRANLLRSVSHDIRTPLTSIVGSTSAILENPNLTGEEQRELLEDARSEAQWLIRVVENLLSITRMGNNQGTHIDKEPEAAEEILGDAVQKFRRRFPAVKVTVEVPDDLLMVPMDPILIVQVLSNLMENAVIHGKHTSHIQVSLQKHDAFACFSVQDNGCGIPEEILPDIFSGSLPQSTSSGDGKRNMGLGLSVCYAIVRAHGGTMEAQNLPIGAEFTFKLPLA